MAVSVDIPGTAKGSSKVKVSDNKQTGKEFQEVFKRSKIDFLRQKILDYQDLFKQLSRLSKGSSYLFLDDLYYIRREDQPQLLDYFHGIAKGNNLWLKIGTIRHRSNWYLHGNPPSGLKLGDDADDIDLDLTLESYALAKSFLITILNRLIQDTSSPTIDNFLAPGAIDRMVLASGGVARDFLGIFWRSISEARERLHHEPKHYRGSKIGAEDVNLAAGKYGDLKMEEFRRDTLDDQHDLEEAFNMVRNFCIEKAQANCFLLDQDINKDRVTHILELVDLRLIHLVRSRVTVSARPGKVYKAYLLDVSQYTGWRLRRDFDMLEFWRKGSREQLRRASLIYEPSQS